MEISLLTFILRTEGVATERFKLLKNLIRFPSGVETVDLGLGQWQVCSVSFFHWTSRYRSHLAGSFRGGSRVLPGVTDFRRVQFVSWLRPWEQMTVTLGSMYRSAVLKF